MVNKTKKLKVNQEETTQDLPFVPPDTHYLAERYVVRLPVSDPHLADPWKLRLHVAKIMERRLGDEIQLTSLKVRQPHVISKSLARLRKREPSARMYVTIKF
jgi:hypothetical protein